MLRTVTGKKPTAQAFYDRLQNRDGEMQGNMFSLMANISGGAQFFSRLQFSVQLLKRQLGVPTLFVTCSTAEWYSQPFLEYLRKVNSSVEGIEWMTPAELTSLDPVNVSIHFEKKWKTIFNRLINSKVNPPFGHVAEHFWRIEYQSRGTPNSGWITVEVSKISKTHRTSPHAYYLTLAL